MSKNPEFFLLLLILVFQGGSLVGETPAPQKIEMRLVNVIDDKERAFVFVVGTTGFTSVEGLKKYLGSLPAGSEIKWDPGCKRMGKEPLLSSDKEMKAFRKFLEEKSLQFNLMPSG